MRRLTLTVTPEQAGRTVRSLLRRELRMADGAIARVKTVPDGICLNGAHARTIDCVAAGDTLTVRIDDKRSGGRFTPVAVPLDILYEDADLLALNKPAGMAVHGGYDRGDPTVANALAGFPPGIREQMVRIGHPEGVVEVKVRLSADGTQVESVGMERTARRIMKGELFIPA